ncbi:hypothetical protein DAPPUDRAFT_103885 [Daphnia pulex]|uniref:Uncharacterized protein n=1 Tax=Daphnia pulex TaxID=6669 RepID=E9GKN6_DAPPU|nr:hypothetical protein DAPPUDRAFT_103885 [Daphnia pulex]|eukprot:EFX80021.1 hypothetical protein DAPPUDRAFT_103885 [Daphnia pulex]
MGRVFFMKEALPERLYFVYGWGQVAAGGPDGDYVGLDEGQGHWSLFESLRLLRRILVESWLWLKFQTSSAFIPLILATQRRIEAQSRSGFAISVLPGCPMFAIRRKSNSSAASQPVQQASQCSKPASAASQPVQQASQCSKPASAASQPVQQASQCSKPASAASQPVQQASQCSKPASAASQPVQQASQCSKPASAGRQVPVPVQQA